MSKGLVGEILMLMAVVLGILVVLTAAFHIVWRPITSHPVENLGEIKDVQVSTGFSGDKCSIKTTKGTYVASGVCYKVETGKNLWKDNHDMYLIR